MPEREALSVTVTTTHVVLVPGFFGFGRLGELTYFAGVKPLLQARLAEAGLDARVVEVTTAPTASIRRRAASVVEAIAAVAAEGGDVHVVGHSTGGLDARLAVAQTAALPTRARIADYERIRSLVSVSCPHFGTNVSTYFTRPLGRAVFRLGARYLSFILRRRRFPLKLLLRLGYFVVRIRDPLRRHRGTFEQLYERLLNDLSEERRLELAQFLEQVSQEQALLFQLTPAGCDLLNACTADPPLAYGSVISCAPTPRFKTLLRSMLNLYTQLMYPVYWVLHRLAREPNDALRQQFAEAQLTALDSGLGRRALGSDTDGVVPVLSQVWGRVLHVAHGDHLDVVGQYGAPGSEGDPNDRSWGGDWLPSASGFDRAAFEALWSKVADFIVEASRHPRQITKRDRESKEEEESGAATDRRSIEVFS
ncbi:MAG: triacylglycerol lipase [Myxococcales bacterium]|nr:MAG: triacylglycerol lipase [Myxococcales bacterium]